ncbi:hypothetical protein CC1G_06792 [Coprinopsis cinerea okayama7|uniref:Uncharacterized protein n=1 Tax=Coprinopsis cinerea (strain Okayama-7 / 130 / ATCC MYA-4618 / FGSC 9003) TaxID=240176 RepID=A8N1R4_COPC7|nr:hypothetical protein CC1G_06792 [Coprinopsis cinerea okayama7\|eukprot:XP_001828806.1 hypothetical protein CC1G_06792 [Coprinopsis cinerea okayama7\
MVNPDSSTPLLGRTSSFSSRQAIWWKTGAAYAATGIMTGAFGELAHGLRKRPGITPDSIHAWETASSYLPTDLLGPPLRLGVPCSLEVSLPWFLREIGMIQVPRPSDAAGWNSDDSRLSFFGFLSLYRAVE